MLSGSLKESAEQLGKITFFTIMHQLLGVPRACWVSAGCGFKTPVSETSCPSLSQLDPEAGINFNEPNETALLDHLTDLFEISKTNIPPEQADMLARVLIANQDVFSVNDLDLGHFTAIEHNIDTGGARPIRQRMRRTPLVFQDEEEKHLQKMLEAGVIRPSKSPWAASRESPHPLKTPSYTTKGSFSSGTPNRRCPLRSLLPTNDNFCTSHEPGAAKPDSSASNVGLEITDTTQGQIAEGFFQSPGSSTVSEGKVELSEDTQSLLKEQLLELPFGLLKLDSQVINI